MNLWRKFKTFLKRPGNYFRYKKKFLRYLYFLFSKYLHFRTYLSRVGPKKFINSNYQNFEFIDDKEGFKLIKASKLTKENTNVKEVVEKINIDLKKIDLNKLKSSEEGIVKLKTSSDFDHKSPEFKFVINKYLIEIVSSYLKCIPILTNLSLWYSPNQKLIENSSQEYHLDHEDYRQIKGFLFINEIDEQTGPVNIINKIQSNNIEKLINYKMTEKNKRVSDKIIQDLKQKINIDENIITGKPGDLLLCDTSSCFHFGSRLAIKPRLILAFQFMTPFSFSVDWNWKNSDRLPYKNLKFDNNSLIRKVLGNEI